MGVDALVMAWAALPSIILGVAKVAAVGHDLPTITTLPRSRHLEMEMRTRHGR
jgi:hypothetical protein